MNEYRGQHQPDPDGVPMHEAETAFPDVYAHPEYYHFGSAAYDRSLSLITRVKGDPGARVTVYRAVPPGVERINPGDWVTPSREYAELHAAQDDDPANDWPVVKRNVKARELLTEGNDVNEWGWFPTA